MSWCSKYSICSMQGELRSYKGYAVSFVTRAQSVLKSDIASPPSSPSFPLQQQPSQILHNVWDCWDPDNVGKPDPESEALLSRLPTVSKLPASVRSRKDDRYFYTLRAKYVKNILIGLWPSSPS